MCGCPWTQTQPLCWALLPVSILPPTALVSECLWRLGYRHTGTQARTRTSWACSARHSRHVHTHRWGLPCNRPVSGRDMLSCMGTLSHPVLITLAFPCMLRDPAFTVLGCSHRGPHPCKIPSLRKRCSPLKPWPQVE